MSRQEQLAGSQRRLVNKGWESSSTTYREIVYVGNLSTDGPMARSAVTLIFRLTGWVTMNYCITASSPSLSFQLNHCDALNRFVSLSRIASGFTVAKLDKRNRLSVGATAR